MILTNINYVINLKEKRRFVVAPPPLTVFIRSCAFIVKCFYVQPTVADSRIINPTKQILGSGEHFHPRPWFPCGRLHRRIVALVDDYKDALDNKPLTSYQGRLWQAISSFGVMKPSTQRNALLSQQVVIPRGKWRNVSKERKLK